MPRSFSSPPLFFPLSCCTNSLNLIQLATFIKNTFVGMVPDGMNASAASWAEDAAVARYRECSLQGMRLPVSGLGSPLVSSRGPHLTKRQPYLEKIYLDFLLVDELLRRKSQNERGEEEEGLLDEASVKTLLVESIFRGCDLRYK